MDVQLLISILSLAHDLLSRHDVGVMNELVILSGVAATMVVPYYLSVWFKGRVGE